jgi:glycogen operon protein
MILGGDEIGRTQGGNNNAYCQDNEVSWYDWDAVDDEFLDWTRRVVAFRAAHPTFRRRRWFQGRLIRGIEDLAWFRPDGKEMNDEDWEMGFAKSVGVFINGDTIATVDPYGERITDETFLLLINASELDLEWKLPPRRFGVRWVVDLDSADPLAGTVERPTVSEDAGGTRLVTARSLTVLRRTERVQARKHPSRRKP